VRLQSVRRLAIEAQRMQCLSVLIACLVMAAVWLLFPSTAAAAASDIYLAQNSTGAANGADCTDALVYSFFNNASNWGGGSNQIGPGTTVHICGAITGTTSFRPFVFQGSGTSGHPVTLLFESGASIQASYCSSTGCINVNGQSNIVINGGTNGYVESTLNGTSGGACLGGPCAYQQLAYGVYLTSCVNCTVENLGMYDMYVRTSTSDESAAGDGVDVFNQGVSGASNLTITGNTMHDGAAGTYIAYGTNDSGGNISNNTIYNVNWGIGVNGQSTGNSAINWLFSGNTIHDLANWNDGQGAEPYNNHHNGIVLFSGNSGTSISAVVYNNYFYGDFGNGTAVFDVQNSNTGTDTVTFFNNYVNLSATTGTTGGNGCIDAENDDSSGSVVFSAYNNTCVGVGSMYGIYITGAIRSTSNVRNNVMVNWGALFSTQDGAALPSVMNYNNWYEPGGNGVWDINSSDYTSLSAWNTATGLDANSAISNPLLASGVPGSGSPAIGLGANLTNLCTGNLVPLCSDKAGVARPSTGAWDAGAYRSNSTTSSGPTPPTGLTASVQ